MWPLTLPTDVANPSLALDFARDRRYPVQQIGDFRQTCLISEPFNRFLLLCIRSSSQGVRLLPEAVPTNLVTNGLSLIGLVGTTIPGAAGFGSDVNLLDSRAIKTELAICNQCRHTATATVIAPRPTVTLKASVSIALTDAKATAKRGRHNSKGDRGMANGTVKWFNTTKGFGFIAPEDGSKDVFVHISAVERAGLTGLADNQKVTFDVEAGRDGRESATNIALA